MKLTDIEIMSYVKRGFNGQYQGISVELCYNGKIVGRVHRSEESHRDLDRRDALKLARKLRREIFTKMTAEVTK